MSTIPDCHNDDANLVGGYAEDQTQTDAKDSIMLHQLCDRCRSFVDGWDFLKWVKDGIDDIYDVRAGPTHFSTVAQLLQSRAACHMYAMVLSILDYSNLDHNQRVQRSVVLLGTVQYTSYFRPYVQKLLRARTAVQRR